MTSLKELQHALATRLTAAPKAPSVAFDRGLLVEFDEAELQQSRETLVRKRLSQIASLLPRTRQALNADYMSLCRAFIDEHHFQGFHAPQLDAIHFAQWLKVQPSVALWQVELANWEALRVEWFISSYWFRIKLFHFDLNNEWIEGVEPPRAGSLWMAFRFAGHGIIAKLWSARRPG